MSIRQAPLVLPLAVAWVLLLTAGSQAATRCGDLNPKTGNAVRGEVSLKEQSFVDASFGTSTDTQFLNLILAVEGCDVRKGEAEPAVETIPRTGANRQIPEGAVVLNKTVADGSELSLRLLVDPRKFEPGSYGGFAEIRAPYLIPSRIPVSLSRSEHLWWKPVLLGAVAGFCGFYFFWFVSKLHGEKTKAPTPYFIIALVIACAVAGGTVYANYADQEVWALHENAMAAFLTGFTAATSGVMAGLVSLLYVTKGSPESTNGTGQPVALGSTQTTTRESGDNETS